MMPPSKAKTKNTYIEYEKMIQKAIETKIQKIKHTNTLVDRVENKDFDLGHSQS